MNTSGRLAGKTIVISGGTKGVGRAAAVEFARQGASVAIGGRDATAAEGCLSLVRETGGCGIFVPTDLHRITDSRRLFAETAKTFGGVDGFFCYAGVTPVSPLDTCGEETFDEVMSVNFKAAFFCCQEAIRYMRERGGGSIVLTGSAHAWGGQKDRAAYACSKGALLTLMEHISHQYAAEQIRCNYLVLGWTPTEGELALRQRQGESAAALRKRAAGILPMGRMPECNDYLEALSYLMSAQAAMMTGSIFRITAGEYI